MAGLVPVLFLCVSVAAAGGSVVVTPHDQLDIEVVSYRLHALHPLDPSLPEWLGGVPSGDVVMASPASIVFYFLLEPRGAFVANWCLVLVVSYLGMFFCLRDLDASPGVCMVFSVLYACVPLYSAFGLTVMGVPLVLLSCRAAVRGRGLRAWLPPLVLYGAFSSLVLCGYAVLACILAFSCLYALRGCRREAARLLMVAGALLVTYAVANMYVLFGMGGGPSHRSEIGLDPMPFSWGNVMSLFLEGKIGGSPVFYHSESAQSYVSLFCLASALVGLGASVGWRLASRGGRAPGGPPWAPALSRVALLLAVAMAVAVFYCLFHSGAAVSLREHLPGALRSFQLDRFYFLYPAIWYLCAGLSAELLLRVAGRILPLRLAASVAVAVVASLTLAIDWSESDALLNARALAGGRPDASGKVTWDSFFAPETFREVKGRIGSGPDAGRVASIGMHPSVAAMNGLYCLDGYCTNYPLAYKHEFRQIIAGELGCSEKLARYFDGWGNRCYLFQHEVGMNFGVGKDSGAGVSDLRLDLDAFAAMGGRYILSAAPIARPESYGLVEVCSCEDPVGLYRVRVYGLSMPAGTTPAKAAGSDAGL